ncbi:MAG: hypothetical protein K6E18_04305 [Lachnospiraceae bacterium]|nr:hypothetical protein [Lachnospiraceae bacterium]
MKLTDDFNEEDKKAVTPLTYMMLGAVAFILIVIIVVISVNDKGHRKKKATSAEDALLAESTQITEETATPEEGGLTADDLDFWDMYKKESTVSEDRVIRDTSYEERLKEMESEEEEKNKEEDLSEGGTKTKVVRPDGAEQWIMINAYITPNSYKEEGFVYKDPMMKYYADGKNVSYQGLNLDESCGMVDFALLKEAGIQFVMLRYGYRGYESGTVKKDAMFEDYFAGASKSGMKIGIYFESAAISQDEAIEEAAFLLKGLSVAGQKEEKPQDVSPIRLPEAADPAKTSQQGGNAGDQQNGDGSEDITDSIVVEQIGDPIQVDEGPSLPPEGELAANGSVTKNAAITYPVCIKMGQAANHTSRTDNIPKTMISLIAKTFCSMVRDAGYHDCVWADKYWLLRRVDLTQLDLKTEVMLEQNGESPDYPYGFALWQYQANGKLSGIRSEARMLLSFVDFGAS